ncbi:MAG: hypothetical protein NC203_03270 [Firmicutes bacterium]|nr:hypothetical protein [[Eubacterium] siraeum]MCM1487365.1 hypothetical protein [Bacillota bacterium]
MSKTCKNCGNTFEDHINICPRCGMQYVENAGMPEQSYQQPYQGQGYNQPAYGQPQYQQPIMNQPVQEQPMTLGQWLGTILLTTMLGTISIILLFVWGFSSTTPTNKKNYCRAMLIVNAIGIVISIIFMAIFFAALSGMPEFSEIFENAYYA